MINKREESEHGYRDTKCLPFKIRSIMERKTCTGCKEEKSQAEFIKMGMYRHPQCDPCRKAYMKKSNDKIAKLKKESRLW